MSSHASVKKADAPRALASLNHGLRMLSSMPIRLPLLLLLVWHVNLFGKPQRLISSTLWCLAHYSNLGRGVPLVALAVDPSTVFGHFDVVFHCNTFVLIMVLPLGVGILHRSVVVELPDCTVKLNAIVRCCVRLMLHCRVCLAGGDGARENVASRRCCVSWCGLIAAILVACLPCALQAVR